MTMNDNIPTEPKTKVNKLISQNSLTFLLPRHKADWLLTFDTQLAWNFENGFKF